ncbi:tRNA-splicing_ligase RtcB [Hexamita inflata]|uniref:3'-phosphate/5'-hydroxy nucleic acid ligase n=1 Tax=Hexamita inflata TaxID=28002 RepID=A0AA86QBW8_9EUKA|nr:tRNA-splicing ligase RtcB [Hexamita inflata]
MQPKILKGKYETAVVYTSELEAQAESQIQHYIDSEIAKNSNVRIMPDVHAGAGCVVGFTSKVTPFVIPQMIGVDIGCGVLAQRLNYKVPAELKQKFFEKLDKTIRQFVPSGFESQKVAIDMDLMKSLFKGNMDFDEFIKELKALTKKVGGNSIQQLGTLGGGNHFIEVDESEDGELWLVVHTGSRNLGKRVAEFHQRLASSTIFTDEKRDQLCETLLKMGDTVEINEQFSKEFIKHVDDQLRKSDRQREINKIHKLIQVVKNESKEQWFIHGNRVVDYCKDMNIAQMYAQLNRKLIINSIQDFINDFQERNELPEFQTSTKLPKDIESVHNYIDFEDNIIRKGSIASYVDRPLIIPLNMKDGAILGFGKSNAEWNNSAPHGAGRQFSRTQAKLNSNLEEFQKSMEGVYSTCVRQDTLDEAPSAYKNSEQLINWLEQTVSIEVIVKSVYNFKAGEE